ncbi:MAG TPA: sulfotransferase [Chthoniobacterales bacterium]
MHPAAPLWLAGCSFLPWARLFFANRRGTKLKCLPALALAAGLSAISSCLGIIQRLIYRRRINEAAVADPIFIIGHWRTGTTLLHNLLALDPRHAAPTGYECACPSHFLLTERWLLLLFDWLPPFRRPMDEMEITARSPQEDEFAYELLGAPSPYRFFTFPNLLGSDPTCDLAAIDVREREAWKETFLGFLRQLTLLRRRRIVLKSPPHSLRIRFLRELFPDARFIHLVRNPYEVVPSTIKMNKALLRLWAVQEITEAQLEEHVFARGAQLYERLEEGKKSIPPNRFHELRYEDLVRDPVDQLRQLYKQLELPGFDDVRPKFDRHMAHLAGYDANKHQLDGRLRDAITRRWGAVINHYGYAAHQNPTATQIAESSIP